MRQLFTQLLMLALFPSILFPALLSDGLSPSAIHVHIESMHVSTSASCENPQRVFENSATNDFKDLATTPIFGTGNVTAGNYPCIILYVNPSTFFKLPNDAIACKKDESYIYNLCTGVDNCDSAASSVPLYFSTNSINDGSRINTKRPTEKNSSNGFKLNTPLTLNQNTSLTLKIVADQNVSFEQSCQMSSPVIKLE